ncbi:MAG TPA: IS110 family transposase [Firmicutes bacterium]|nr:IS110 family transposase [Bacillota bacterium]
MTDYITYVGIDAHKAEHKVYILYPEPLKPDSVIVKNHEKEIKRFVKRLIKKVPGDIRMCYEAGPCGFELQRQLDALGIDCEVIAPSCTPQKPGERVKTDRRDAKKLAEYYRAGMLTSIKPPTRVEEAVRDLCRCREAAKCTQKRAQHQLQKFLLRHGRNYVEGELWTQKYFNWIRTLQWNNPIERRVFEDYLIEVERCLDRVKALEEEIEKWSQQEPYCEPVGWLRCFRGIDTITAMTVVVELYDFSRFKSPGELMSFLGLTPSENSSGENKKKGGITKTGNSHVRRLLVESAWHHRLQVRTSIALRKRRKGQPPWVIALADKAMRRLHKRYIKLRQMGKAKQVVTTAIARELVGFLWAVLTQQKVNNVTPSAPSRENAF